MKHSYFLLDLIVMIALIVMNVNIQAQPSAETKFYDTPENLIAEIYKTVSFTADGPLPDWEKVRSMLIDDALIVMRVSLDSMAVLSVDDFIDDFVNFIEDSPAKAV